MISRRMWFANWAVEAVALFVECFSIKEHLDLYPIGHFCIVKLLVLRRGISCLTKYDALCFIWLYDFM